MLLNDNFFFLMCSYREQNKEKKILIRIKEYITATKQENAFVFVKNWALSFLVDSCVRKVLAN